MMKSPSAHRRARGGFTLIELMVAVAIVAILASIALPAYTDYVLRSKIPDGTNELSAMRARMEQYYQDHRTYVGDDSPCAKATTSGKKYFAISCVVTATAYTVTATGQNGADGFVYKIDNAGSESTTRLPPRWGTVPAGTGYGCWITRRGDTC